MRPGTRVVHLDSGRQGVVVGKAFAPGTLIVRWNGSCGGNVVRESEVTTLLVAGHMIWRRRCTRG